MLFSRLIRSTLHPENPRAQRLLRCQRLHLFHHRRRQSRWRDQIDRSASQIGHLLALDDAPKLLNDVREFVDVVVTRVKTPARRESNDTADQPP